MKNIIAIVMVGFFLIGCTTKEQTDLKPYVSMHTNKKQDIKINFLGVEDKRASKVVAMIYNKEQVLKAYPMSNNMEKWYTTALIRELKNSEMHTDTKTDIKVSVNIKEIDIKYQKYSLDKKNMSAHILLELIIKKENLTLTSNITINQTNYKPMIIDASGFDDILNESMQDSVAKTVAILIKKLQNLK